jgi:subtilisin family serine protease
VSRSLRALVAVSLLAMLIGGGSAAHEPGVGTYIVVLDDSVADPGVAAEHLADAHGGQVGFVYRHALKGFSIAASAQTATALASNPLVRSVEADQVAQIAAQEVPTGVQRIFADDNPEVDIDGSDDFRVDVDIAIIDTGIDLDHADLNVVASTNCSGGGPFKQSCGSGGNDDNGHGSHVAGSAAALDNGVGVVGVAPGARLWAVKVLNSNGSGYISWIVAGIDYVTANAASIEVANMSLGCECASTAMDTAIANSVNAGVAYAVAAGNSDKDATTFSPANHPDVLTVSALADFDGDPGGLVGTSTSPPYCRVDQDDTLADFSNWGSKVEIAAPGVCILSTWNDGGYNTISGTSMASPHAAGALALLASVNNPSNQTGVQALYDTLEANGNLNWTDDSGDGVKEPLLDVSNQTVFNPVLVAGSGSGGTNNPPVANDVAASGDEDTVIAWSPSVSDPDVGNTLSCSIAAQPSSGIATVASNCSSGSYTPNPNFNGNDGFTYQVSDGNGGSDTGTVIITVNPVNDAPVAVDDAYSTPVETTMSVAAPGVLGNDSDVDGPSLSVASHTGASSGSVTVNPDGSFTYTPNAGFSGTDSFTYTVSDGNLSDSGTVTITVGTPITMHVADLDGSSTNNGSTWTAAVTILVVDAAGTPVSGAAVSGNWTVNSSTSTGGCTTGPTGTCSVSKTSIPKRVGSVSYTVTGVSHASLSYNATANTDPDGDSNGTTISVAKP